MSISLSTFADKIRPKPQRPVPPVLNNSIFDAGSPQYVRPEDMLLDMQSYLFNIDRKAAKELEEIHHQDFRRRWLKYGSGQLSDNVVGEIVPDILVHTLLNLLKCARRKSEQYPSLLPVHASLGYYKNITKNLPNYWNDQLSPALTFADPDNFDERVHKLRATFTCNIDSKDRVEQVAYSLLPGQLDSRVVTRYKGPYLLDYSVSPPKPIPVCASLVELLDTLMSLSSKLPRVLRVRWLSSLFRIWLPMFFLKRCAVTSTAFSIFRSTLEAGHFKLDDETITRQLLNGKPLLRGSTEWLIQLHPVIQQYVRARLQLSIILEICNIHEWLVSVNNVDPTDPTNDTNIRNLLSTIFSTETKANNLPEPCGVINGKKLSMPRDGAEGNLSFASLLQWITEKRSGLDSLSCIFGAQNLLDFVDRVYSYLRPSYEPLKTGFGKNALEYVSYLLGAPRKIDRDPAFPDEFNLLYRGEGGFRARCISIQPGPQLLVMLVQLLSYKFENRQAKLGDLLDLFDSLGIDFTTEPVHFDVLTRQLVELGLLESSADAAQAANLKPRYTLRKET